MKKSLDELGLPNGSKVICLAHHEPTRTLIAHIDPIKNMPPQRRLYFRWATDERYQPVGSFAESLSIDSVLLDPARPSLYFLTGAWKKRKDGGAAGDWDALYRFDLEEHRSERLTERGKLLPTTGYEETWLCDLLSLSADGRALFCRAALRTPLVSRISRVDYWIARLDLATMGLEAITMLPAIWA